MQIKGKRQIILVWKSAIERGQKVEGRMYIMRELIVREIIALIVRYKLLMDSGPDGILFTKETGEVFEANKAAGLIYGYSNEELLKLTIHDIEHHSFRDDFVEHMKKSEKTGITFERIHVRKDGSSFPVEVSSRGSVMGGTEKVWVHIIRDISERKSAEERFLFLATHDGLTGISNRTNLFDQLESEILHAGRNNSYIAVMFFDIDRFKSINDIYGHHVGDVVLQTVASRAKACIRKIDTVARFGGDEFVIVQPLLEEEDDIHSFVTRLFERMKEPVKTEEFEILISISLGICFFPDNGLCAEDLIRAADTAMYDAKKRHGNSYSIYEITRE